MLLIYTPKITNRVRYIFKLIFNQLLKTNFDFTDDKEVFLAADRPKINYSGKPLGEGIFICSSNLLFERDIIDQNLEFTEFAGMPAFYPTYDKRSAVPFDPFAASFYLVSRYEEYLPYMKDEHGRFKASDSLAFQKGFLHKPIVNIWSRELATLIEKYYSGINFGEKKYKFVPTFDIDAAYAYRLKGIIRTMGGYMRSISELNISEVVERTKVLSGITRDPFDTYQYMLSIQKKYDLKPIYFILFADYGLNDKNIPVYNRQFHVLIKSIADYSEVGIHPSYGSGDNPGKLKNELNRLSKVLNKEITKSRQHFLRLSLPSTYRTLINMDITDDYTMGFASEPGFRAGICDPFPFYDLDMETETKLQIHPFEVMEGTLKDYKNTSINEAIDSVKSIIDEVKAVDGTFIPLWHNESLSNVNRWTGWRTVFEEMIEEARKIH